NQAVYDALVRLAQDFSQRYPLVDGQGNFGNVDGDNPAAMRYTEARLTEVARLLIDGIDEDAIDFRPTYDGSENEPAVLPGARPHKEDTGRGTYLIVVTEIPWLVQKGRLVERIAELINEKKLPLLADMRDESAEDIRIVIEPRSRAVDETLLMESLFKLTELKSRIPLNMNVLVKGRIPRVVGL